MAPDAQIRLGLWFDSYVKHLEGGVLSVFAFRIYESWFSYDMEQKDIWHDPMSMSAD